MKKLIGYLRLMRPANIVTAVADILAGVSLSGYWAIGHYPPGNVGWLILSTIGLYGGGVVFNDVFDAALDRVERPERPIPSGLISHQEGTVLGAFLLAMGVTSAFQVSAISGAFAMAIAIAALVYDRFGKHHAVAGPMNMGLCRGLNLLLGVSIAADVLGALWVVGFVPLVYIAAVTVVSRGEVHGSHSKPLRLAALLYGLVMVAILAAAWTKGNLLWGTILLVAWAAMVFLPLLKAMRQPHGKMIGKAVKAGVLALILMDAAWAASSGLILPAIGIALLLPVSIFLARIFAVT